MMMMMIIMIIIIIITLNVFFSKCISLCYTGLVIPLGSKRTFCFRFVDAKKCIYYCRIFYDYNLVFLFLILMLMFFNYLICNASPNKKIDDHTF